MAKKQGHVPYFLPQTKSLVQVPVEDMEKVESSGYVQASPEEESSYYETRDYLAQNGAIERQIKGAAVGAVSGVLGVPALAAHVTGIDPGASGHSYLADLIATGDDEEERAMIERGVRTIARHGEAGHFVGELIPMAIGSGATSALTKAGAKTVGTKVAAKATAKGAALEVAEKAGEKAAARAVLSGEMLESAAANVVITNEQMFVENREATAEVLVGAMGVGLLGPLAGNAIAAGMSKGRAFAQRAASKLDDSRATAAAATKANSFERHATTVAKSDPDLAYAEAAAKKATARYTKVKDGDIPPALRKKLSADFDGAAKLEQRALDNLSKREAKLAAMGEGVDPARLAEAKRAVEVARKASTSAAAAREALESVVEKSVKTEIDEATMARLGKLRAVEEKASARAAREEARTAVEGASDESYKRLAHAKIVASVAKAKREALEFNIDPTQLKNAADSAGAAMAAKADDAVAKATARLEREEARLASLVASGSKKTKGASKAIDDARELVESAKAARAAAKEARDRAVAEVPDVARAAMGAANDRLAGATAKARADAVASFKWVEPPRGKVADLFTPGRRLHGAADLLGEASEKVSGSRRVGVGLSYNLERRTRGIFGGGGGSVAGGMLGGAAGGSLLGSIAGGVVGAAAVEMGPRVAGIGLKKVSDGLKTMARNAGKANVSSKTAVSRAVAKSAAAVARQAYRTRFYLHVAAIDRENNAHIHDPQAFIEEIGDTYGDLDSLAPGMVDAVTRQNVAVLSYLKTQAPPLRPKYPGMPQLGNTEPTLPEMESYMRKVQAVMNPFFITEALSDGNLHTDTVEAMDAVYPLMMLDIREQVLESLAESEEPLDRKRAISVDKLFGGVGAIHRPNSPGFQGRLGVTSEEEQSKRQGAPKGGKPGRPSGMPSLSQQMKSPAQVASEGLGNH